MTINTQLLFSNCNKTYLGLYLRKIGLYRKFLKNNCFYSLGLGYFHADIHTLRPSWHPITELTLSKNKPFIQINCGQNFMSENKLSAESCTKKMKLEDTLVWIDLEMTGLDVDKEEIMEAAVIVTDSNLETIKEGPDLVLKVEEKILNNMGDWCKEHHGQSGLTESCRKSDTSLAMAEEQILEFISLYTEKGKAPLAGNSIHADKRFLDKYMPKLMKHLHYRIVDVSTVKELCRRWYPEDFEGAPKKKGTHRALDDIRESIEELKYYRSKIFK